MSKQDKNTGKQVPKGLLKNTVNCAPSLQKKSAQTASKHLASFLDMNAWQQDRILTAFSFSSGLTLLNGHKTNGHKFEPSN